MSLPSHAPLLADLRQATGHAHARLDGAFAAGSAALTHERYVALLRATLTVLAPLEHGLADHLPDLASCGRAASIRADLARLGAENQESPIDVPVPRGLAEAYGIAYVVEGSTLGGLVLAARFEAALGLAPGVATRFLRLRGDHTGSSWRAFLARLAAAETAFDPNERSAACAAACAVFDAYHAAFTAHGVVA